MLANTLVTNEVKDAAGVEVEFERLSTEGRSTVFAVKSESPAHPYRLSISHQEIGTGTAKRRRSKVRIDKTVSSTEDTPKNCTCTCYAVLDAPIGALAANIEFKHVLANLLSFLGSTGADATLKFDCTGTGAVSLIDGSI